MSEGIASGRARIVASEHVGAVACKRAGAAASTIMQLQEQKTATHAASNRAYVVIKVGERIACG